MLFTIDHPELMSHLKTLGYGLLPVFHKGEGRYLLVVKVTKEMILTARINNAFKVYLLGDEADPVSYLGFVTAFFDDPDEPLTIRSPLFTDDELLKDLIGLLSHPEFDVYFFDEHDREMMGVRAHNPDAGRFRSEMEAARFSSYVGVDFKAVLQRLERRFSVRDAEDDAKAFTITLGARLYPDDFVFIDGRDEVYQFQGADRSAAMTSLEREEPGPFQERDIAVMLGRVFDGSSIYLNPIRDDTGKELTDVLIVTVDEMLFIQAKDSPNTEAAIRRTIERKRSAIRSHINKAAKQLRGAIGHAVKSGSVVIRTAEGPVTLPVGDRALVGLVVVREMFDDDYAACSAPVLDLVRALERPAILLDYSGLHILAQSLRAPERFINGLGRMFEMALEKDEFPKPVWLGSPSQN